MKDDRTGEESAWGVKKILEDGKLRDNCNSRGKEVENQVPVDLKQIDSQIILQQNLETRDNFNSGHAVWGQTTHKSRETKEDNALLWTWEGVL